MRNNSAAGEDKVKNEFLKYGGEKLEEALTMVLNGFWEEGRTPGGWNVEGVTLIHKGGDKLLLDNYRGIAVSSVVGKLFARVLANRLLVRAETAGWLPEEQGAFRTGRGVEDHLFVLDWLMERVKRAKTTLMLAFIDLRKAYVSVDRDLLWRTLEEKGVGCRMLTALKSLYKDNERYVKVGKGETGRFRCYRGLRQGCPLSPILFALLVADIPAALQQVAGGVPLGDQMVRCMFYADDIVLINGGEWEMVLQLGVLFREIEARQMTINMRKSFVMVKVEGRRVCSQELTQERVWVVRDQIGGVTGGLRETNEYKYLGIVIGRSSGYNGCRNGKIRRGRRKVGALKALASQAMDRIRVGYAAWTRAVRVELLYGCSIVNCPKSWVRQLEVLQSGVGRWLLGVSRRVRTSTIRRVLGLSTIQAEIARMKIGWMARVVQMEDTRWPKIVLKEMREIGMRCTWWKETNRYVEEYEIEEEDLTDKSAKGRIKRKIQEKLRQGYEARQCPEHCRAEAEKGAVNWAMMGGRVIVPDSRGRYGSEMCMVRQVYRTWGSALDVGPRLQDACSTTSCIGVVTRE